MLFSMFYSFSPTQYAVLVLLITSVMALETVNTCVEDLCGLVADRYEPLVKFAKDAAAGAVLTVALGADNPENRVDLYHDKNKDHYIEHSTNRYIFS